MFNNRLLILLPMMLLTLVSSGQVRDISVKSASRKMDKNITIIDVRTSEEFNDGHLQQALNFDIKDTTVFLQQVNELDKEKRYLIYCRTGKRSSVAAKLMAENGFTRLYNMKGGYVAWLKKDE